MLTEIGVLLTLLCGVSAGGETLLHLRAGAHPDSSNPQGAVTFEGKYYPPVSPRLEFSTRIDRPFNRYENFSVPFLKGQIQFSLLPARQTGEVRNTELELRPYLSVLALDRWSTDGARGRAGANVVVRHLFSPLLTAQFEVAPWLELSQFRASPEGREFPIFGFSQKLTVEASYRNLFLELVFLTQQSRRTLWRNDWGVQQRLGYRFSPSIQAGLAHDYVSPRLDESTGRIRSLAFYDARVSRIALFGEFLL